MQLTDPVSIFTAVLLLVLLVPLLFSRLRIPPIAGLILAGMAAGPNGLGLLSRDGTFELLGKVGLLYLMFLAGLEISLREFRHRINNTLTFGALTFLFPQIIGTLIAVQMGLPWPAAILMASMFASHTLVPYPIVQKLGIGKHRAVSTTVGGTILTDTAAMVILAIIAEGARAGDAGINWWAQISLLVLLLIFGIFLLPRIASWFYHAIEPDGITEFVFILSAAFLTSSLAQRAGMEAIIGSFLAGLALSSLLPEQSIVMRRLQFTGNALFIPFFLLSTGMLIDPRVFLSDMRTIQMCVFMTTTGIITKWLASEVAGRILGFSPAERGVVYGLSVNQAAATLAAVMVGYNLGIFDLSILNGTIAMILITCMVGPLVTEYFAPRLAEEAGKQDSDISAVQQGPLMVAVSSDRHREELLDLALLVREEKSDSPMHVLNVADELSATAQAVSHSETLLGRIVARLASGGIQAIPQIRVDTNPTRGILRAVHELHIDTLILGSSPSSARNFFAESLSTQILQASPCMTLIAEHRQPLNTCRRVIMILPPLLERHTGMTRILTTFALLTRQLGASITLAGERKTVETVKHMKRIPDEIARADTFTRDPFRTLIKDLDEMIAHDDLVVILNTRAGSLGWQPMLDRYPRGLRKRQQAPNILMVFPPLTAEKAPADAVAHPADGNEFALPCGVQNVVMELERCPSTPQAAVSLVLKSQQSVPIPAIEQWVHALAGMEPVELGNGVLLLHSHLPTTNEPRVFTGKFQEAASWPGVTTPVNMLILLISPAESAPEKHLETLAGIVKWVHLKAEQDT